MLSVSFRFSLTSRSRPRRPLDANDVVASFPREGILSKKMRLGKKMSRYVDVILEWATRMKIRTTSYLIFEERGTTVSP